MLARCEGGDAGSDFADDAREFMAERYWYRVVGYWMGLCGREGRAAEVFVEICSADSDVGRGDLSVFLSVGAIPSHE